MTDRPGEDDLIARYFAPLAGPAGLGLKDDAALLTPPPGRDLVLTTDALVAGVHFFADDPAGAIARKALRVNLSDLAAKGAAPLGFLLSLALPAGWTADWLEDFARGLGEDARAYDCPLLGGDTVKTPGPLTLSITALGSAPTGGMVARTGVRPGDRLYVSGTIGDAALGLRLRLGQGPLLSEARRLHLLDRYLLPRPRLALAPAMRFRARRDGRFGRAHWRPREDAPRQRRERERRSRAPAAVGCGDGGDRSGSGSVRDCRDRRRRL